MLNNIDCTQACPEGREVSALEQENRLLRQENENLRRQAEDVATAKAHVAELTARLEEMNDALSGEVERRRQVEQELRRVDNRLEMRVQKRTRELAAANERLAREVEERGQVELSLRESENRLRSVLGAILTGVLIVDGQTHEIVDANPHAVEIIGLPKDQIVGRVCHRFVCPTEEGNCPISDLGQTVDRSERTLLRADGSRVPILKTVVSSTWQGREYLIESFMDITERYVADRKQAALLRQVGEINEELSRFAYVVSHDLKAPLRGIKLLSEWLCADCGDKLDAEAKEQIALLQNRVDRMHNLIDGVLEYSRVGRIQEDAVEVNLNELLPTIVDAIAPPAHIQVIIQNNLPTIVGGKTRITQVFQNLLANAVRYMDKPQGEVRVGCTEQADFWEFNVTDNGPGIEEKYFMKIFQVFQTLAPRDECGGTGIGLAIVKKIVERFGGTIRVESTPGKGAAFIFTLPKREASVSVLSTETQVVNCA